MDLCFSAMIALDRFLFIHSDWKSLASKLYAFTRLNCILTLRSPVKWVWLEVHECYLVKLWHMYRLCDWKSLHIKSRTVSVRFIEYAKTHWVYFLCAHSSAEKLIQSLCMLYCIFKLVLAYFSTLFNNLIWLRRSFKSAYTNFEISNNSNNIYYVRRFVCPIFLNFINQNHVLKICIYLHIESHFSIVAFVRMLNSSIHR